MLGTDRLERKRSHYSRSEMFSCMAGRIRRNRKPGRARILEQVRGFIEQHGASRFEDLKATEEQRIINRAGFFKDTGKGREFYVLPQAYRKELCSGFDMKTVSNVLIKHGYLIPGSSGKSAQTRKLPGLGEKARCYVLGPSLFSSETA